jgi:hypothetical protein
MDRRRGMDLPYVARLSSQEDFFFNFFNLHENFRGIICVLLLKSLFQHRGRLNIKIKENGKKNLLFFLKKSNDN